MGRSFLAPFGIFLKGWTLSAVHLVPHQNVGGTGVAGGFHVPLLGPVQDFGVAGGLTAYAGTGGDGHQGGVLGSVLLRLGLGLRTKSLVFALLGAGGVSGWKDQIPASAEVGPEFNVRWDIDDIGPALHFYIRPTWVANGERRAASRLDGVDELTLGMHVTVSKEIPIAANISYAETMGTQMVVVGFGAGMLDWIVAR